ncbi:hypothetical protein DV738_g3499, partial [Chaetothyriales sp. CBS 135597]
MAARPRESAQIGAFQRQEEIGRGSFATVYKALHTDAQHRQSLVAIKSVTLAKLNKKLKDNLTSEIHILKGLHHPHIVALVDCKESASHIHLIMEYVALGDLSQFIKKRDSVAANPMVAGMMDKYPNPRVGGLHEVVVRHFLQQLASALAFLRARNLIHRDVKPQNLLLSPSPLFFEAGHAGLMPYCATADALTPVVGKSEDKIKFGDEIHISRPVKELVRALLKRDPRQRISFEDLFAHSIITGPIPGLVAEDRPGPVENAHGSRSRAVSVSEEGPLHPAATPNPLRRQSTTPSATSNPLRRQSSINTATPTRKHSTASPSPPLAPTAMARQNSAGGNDVRPPSSLRKEINDDREYKQRQEQTAQDIAFERDYVVVEKKAVEVNALADELDASPRLSRGLTHLTQSPKSSPARTGSVPVSAAGVNTGAQASAVRAVHMAAGRPLQQQGQQQHQRQHSYERRYGPSPTSATSAISKALNMASGRLFGIGISPPVTLVRTGDRQPQLYSPFPPYPGSNSSLVLVGEPQRAAPLDQDSAFVQHVEEIATRSDVVYGFAEVKYKQLIPATPSANQASLAMRGNVVDPASDTETDDMTVEATVTVAQEALVLYLKSLSLMAKGMAVAARWWAKKDRRPGEDSLAKTPTQTNVAASQRMNAVVQWIRARFNEVLEKSEIVRMKLIDNQRRLPEDHPSHPNNISAATASTGSNAIASADPIIITPGITAEKLMYDRALEMSRSAAINELTGDDLPGCEISYVTAIRMLEAVLESDQDSADEPDKDDKDDDAPINGLEAEDRKTLKNLVLGIRQRLTSLRRKLQVMQKRASAPPLASPVRVSPPTASYRPSSRAAAAPASPR